MNVAIGIKWMHKVIAMYPLQIPNWTPLPVTPTKVLNTLKLPHLAKLAARKWHFQENPPLSSFLSTWLSSLQKSFSSAGMRSSWNYLSNALPPLPMKRNEGNTLYFESEPKIYPDQNKWISWSHKKLWPGEQLPWWGLCSKYSKSLLKIGIQYPETLQYHHLIILALEETWSMPTGPFSSLCLCTRTDIP